MTKTPRHKGFTLIELVVILVLAGVMAAVTIPYFLNPTAFDSMAARDALIGVIRTAQQASLGRSDVVVKIQSIADRWEVLAQQSGTELRRIEFSNKVVVLETGDVIASGDTCATAFDTAVASDFELAFNNKGDLGSFTNNGSIHAAGPTFNGVRLCVDDLDFFSVCVSPAGYAYGGVCDD